jgi:hypothetical protein
MTIEQMKARIAELQNMAKQHEAILLQISGAIQEFTRIIAEDDSKGKENAPNQVDGAEGV